MNTKHTTTENIECPQCGHSFAANQAFKDHIQREAELLTEKKVSEINKKHQSELQVARNAEQQVEERAQQISLEKMDSYLSETRRARKSLQLKLEVQQLGSVSNLKQRTKMQL